MRCKANFRPPRIDIAAYRGKLKKHMTEKISEALYNYLEAALRHSAVGEMPTWSGGSRATFLQLARAIEYDVPIDRATGAPNREQQGVSESFGELNPNKDGKDRYTFTYNTTLPWLVTNENYDATAWGFPLHTPGPYQFQLAGIKAFEELAKEVHLLPVVTKVKSIRVG